MKQLFFCTFIILLSFLANAQTQEKYQEHYQEAYEFANTGYDSASIYKSFYLLAYAAGQACSYHRALYGFRQAQKYVSDSLTYIKVNASIASTLFNIGDYKQAKKVTQQNIDFLQRHQNFTQLSYAYNLQGRILLEEKKESALPALRQALALRRQYAPKRIADSYESLAQAFFRFSIYDSAAYYQHQIIAGAAANMPADEQAYNYATLAKYLSFDRRPARALPWLQRAEEICCRQAEPALFVAQARAVWLLASQGAATAQADFKRLDSLLSAAMQHKTHLIDKRALNKKHIRIYRDILQAPAWPPALRDKYAAKLEAAQAWYANYSQRLAAQDQQRAQMLAAQLAQAHAQRWYATRLPLYLGLGALVLVMGWLVYKVWLQRLLPEQRQIQDEKALIKALRQKLQRNLNPDEAQLATLMYRGKSFAEVAAELGTNRDKAKYHAKKLADEAQLDSLFQFVTDFKVQRQKKVAQSTWVKPRPNQAP